MLEPATWLRTCWACHAAALDDMPIVEQLALKKIHDIECYDRLAVNLIRRPNAPECITESEVNAAMEILR